MGRFYITEEDYLDFEKEEKERNKKKEKLKAQKESLINDTMIYGAKLKEHYELMTLEDRYYLNEGVISSIIEAFKIFFGWIASLFKKESETIEVVAKQMKQDQNQKIVDELDKEVKSLQHQNHYHHRMKIKNNHLNHNLNMKKNLMHNKMYPKLLKYDL